MAEFSPAPLALIFALACLLVAQLVLPRERTASPLLQTRPSSPPSVVIAPTPLSPSIVQRPLFTPTRSPGGVGPSPESEPQFTDYTLVGVTRARGFASATLSGPGGRLVDLRPGQSLFGWRLEAVSADAAIFALNGQQRRLTASGSPTAPASLVH